MDKNNFVAVVILVLMILATAPLWPDAIAGFKSWRDRLMEAIRR